MTSAMIRDLSAWVTAAPDDLAILTGTDALTVSQFADRVSALSGALRASKVKPAELVAISADGIDEVAGLCAVQAVNAVSVVTPSESEFRETGATRLLHGGRSWAPEGSIDTTAKSAKEWTGWIGDDGETPDRVVHVCLTSGTTGQSKLVEMTEKTAARRTNGYTELWPVAKAVSLFRSSSIAGFGAVISAIRERQPYIPVSVLDRPTLELIASPRVTGLSGAPNQVVQLVLAAEAAQIDLRFTTILTAGAPQTAQFLTVARRVCNGVISNVYGSTECGTAAYSTEEAAAAFRGKPALSSVFEAVDPDRRPVPPGVEGEIRYRGPAQCTTYRVNGAPVSITDDEGWFYPGDTGRIEPDGTVVITGRVGDVINIGGVKINPLIVEAAAESIDGVLDAACVPVTLPNGMAHLVLAIVVRNQEARAALVSMLESRDPIGRPNLVIDVPAIPRNRNGKIDRSVLSEKLAGAIQITPAT